MPDLAVLIIVCVLTYSFEIVYGLAGTIIMVTVLSVIYDAKTLVIYSVLPQILVGTIGLWRSPRTVDPRVLGAMLMFAMIGALAGLLIFYHFPEHLFRQLLASAITLFGILLVARPPEVKCQELHGVVHRHRSRSDDVRRLLVQAAALPVGKTLVGGLLDEPVPEAQKARAGPFHEGTHCRGGAPGRYLPVRPAKACQQRAGEADAEHRRGLRLRQIEKVAACDHESVLLRQVVGRCDERPAPFACEQGRLGGGGRLPRGSLLGRSQRKSGAPTGRPPAVPRLVRHDLQEPWAKGRARAEAVQGQPRLDERVLSGVFGLGGSSGYQVRSSECDPLVSVHERLVGGGVSALRLCDELALLGWTALHSPTITPGGRRRFPRGPGEEVGAL